MQSMDLYRFGNEYRRESVHRFGVPGENSSTDQTRGMCAPVDLSLPATLQHKKL